MQESGAVADHIGDPILVRYDGLDAEVHEIEMAGLAESMKGLARIISIAANFGHTQRYLQHKDALSVKVVVRPPEAHCFEIMAFVKWASQNAYVAGTSATLTAGLITYILTYAAGKREEMRHLKDSLDAAIRELGNRDQAVIEKLLGTIDRMAESLRPAAKQAVAPIGESVSKLTIGTPTEPSKITLDLEDKNAIIAESAPEVDDEKKYHVKISELDLENGKCKLRLMDDPAIRYDGRITDPALSMPDNKYILAMSAHAELVVRAKAVIKDDKIVEIYISNTT